MCFAIKPGLNGMLDVSRRTYTEIIEDIQILVRNLSLEYSLPLKVAFNSTRGFFIQMYDPVARRTNSDRQLPELFKKITKINGNYSFTTDELIRLNGRLNETLSEIFSLSSKVLEDLVLQISQFLTCVYKLIDSVSIVDMLYSLATYRTTLEESCKPEFTDTLVLTHCHHPLIEKNRISVPNNVYCSPTQNINIITGRNMISEINYILTNASEKSLILIDEFARGTSSEEAHALCITTLESISKLKSFTFFATHFLELTKLEFFYPNFSKYLILYSVKVVAAIAVNSIL
ncbi:MAG: MutS protein msh4 [Marteilia pararefringens]